MPLGKSPALTPGRLAAEGRDSRLCGNGVFLGREPIRATGRTPFGPTAREKNFFIRFEAGMLLKTRESRTNYMNFERFFRGKCVGFAIFDTNSQGFARFKAHPEAYLEDRCQGSGVRCQVSGPSVGG
jgi:hypothetical protein